jgi:CheY-like chemotaxis protein
MPTSPLDPLPAKPFAGICVLVVDDDPGVLDTTRQTLERLGAWVRTAQNGEAGVRAVARDRPHLILIDFDMPNMGGVELARQLRQDARLGRTRLVALTSPHTRLADLRAWSVEFDGKMKKPVTEQALIALARHLPGGRAFPASE